MAAVSSSGGAVEVGVEVRNGLGRDGLLVQPVFYPRQGLVAVFIGVEIGVRQCGGAVPGLPAFFRPGRVLRPFLLQQPHAAPGEPAGGHALLAQVALQALRGVGHGVLGAAAGLYRDASGIVL